MCHRSSRTYGYKKKISKKFYAIITERVKQIARLDFMPSAEESLCAIDLISTVMHFGRGGKYL